MPGSDTGPSDVGPPPLDAVEDGAVLHASAVAFQDRALLILGAAGSGKSTLALQMIALGCSLIADDAACLHAGDDGAYLSCPDAIAGRIEARGLGLLRVPAVGPVRVCAALRLVATTSPRLPARAEIVLAGYPVPLFNAAPTANVASTMILALRHNSFPDDQHP